jgi:hypothetical protein
VWIFAPTGLVVEWKNEWGTEITSDKVGPRTWEWKMKNVRMRPPEEKRTREKRPKVAPVLSSDSTASRMQRESRKKEGKKIPETGCR